MPISVPPKVLAFIQERLGDAERFDNVTQGFVWSVAYLQKQADAFGSLEEFERFVTEAGPGWRERHADKLTQKPVRKR